jgi:hypothetical protein
MIPHLETFLAFARQLEGEALQTLWRKQTFYVAVIGQNLEFTPASSRVSRDERHDQVAAILQRLAQTGSFRTSDYADLSFNASYVLTLVKYWQAIK